MKFTVAKQDLDAALSVVAPAVSGTGDDLTTHFLFRTPLSGEAGKMEVLGHSGRVIALCPFVASYEVEDGKASMFTIEAGNFRRWLEHTPDAAIVVTFDDDTKKVAAFAEGFKKHALYRGSSLDPANWHFWDKSIDDAVVTMKIAANRFYVALNHSHLFASTQETQTPENCVCEVKNEVLASTDRISASLIKIPGIEKSTLKIHVRDVSDILAFLSTMKDQDVEILEHPRTTFFRRQDGAVYGESRFTASFPGFRRPRDTDDRKWTFDIANLRRQLLALAASAEKDDRRVKFVRDGSSVMLSMAVKGTKESNPVEIDLLDESVLNDKVVPLPSDGFALPHPHLLSILDRAKGDKITFGINVKMVDGEVSGGYVRIVDHEFNDEKGEGGDEYVTVLAFMTDDMK